MKTLLTGPEVDLFLRYPRGRAAQLAKAGRLPFICLPDGQISSDREAIEKLLDVSEVQPVGTAAGEVPVHA